MFSDAVDFPVSTRSSEPVKFSDSYLQTSKLGMYLRIDCPVSPSLKNKIRLHLGSLLRRCIRLQTGIFVADLKHTSLIPCRYIIRKYNLLPSPSPIRQVNEKSYQECEGILKMRNFNFHRNNLGAPLMKSCPSIGLLRNKI